MKDTSAWEKAEEDEKDEEEEEEEEEAEEGGTQQGRAPDTNTFLD